MWEDVEMHTKDNIQTDHLPKEIQGTQTVRNWLAIDPTQETLLRTALQELIQQVQILETIRLHQLQQERLEAQQIIQIKLSKIQIQEVQSEITTILEA